MDNCYYLSIDLIDNYEKNVAKKVSKLEDLVDHYEDELGTYLMTTLKQLWITAIPAASAASSIKANGYKAFTAF